MILPQADHYAGPGAGKYQVALTGSLNNLALVIHDGRLHAEEWETLEQNDTQAVANI